MISYNIATEKIEYELSWSFLKIFCPWIELQIVFYGKTHGQFLLFNEWLWKQQNET